jgi:hypothetical protein
MIEGIRIVCPGFVLCPLLSGCDFRDAPVGPADPHGKSSDQHQSSCDLLGMNVYPPHDVRLQTVVATGLIVVGFLLLMYQALRLVRHPLLSRMFTQHCDEMALGGVVSALWPKLIAPSVTLVPVLFPDSWARCGTS